MLRKAPAAINRKLTHKNTIDRRDSLDISLAQLHMDEAASMNRESFSCLKSLFSCFIKT